MKFVLVLLIALSVGIAAAADKPAWTTHVPPDTATTLFFVGRSPKVASEAEGLAMASKDAREQLLRQEFGTTIKVNSTQTETLKDVSLDLKLSEVSDLVNLKGFKQTDVYSESENGYVEVWAIFSVSKVDVTAEKKRISELKKARAIGKVAPIIDPNYFLVDFKKCNRVHSFASSMSFYKTSVSGFKLTCKFTGNLGSAYHFEGEHTDKEYACDKDPYDGYKITHPTFFWRSEYRAPMLLPPYAPSGIFVNCDFTTHSCTSSESLYAANGNLDVEYYECHGKYQSASPPKQIIIKNTKNQ